MLHNVKYIHHFLQHAFDLIGQPVFIEKIKKKMEKCWKFFFHFFFFVGKMTG